jgi:hypothetical protein
MQIILQDNQWGVVLIGYAENGRIYKRGNAVFMGEHAEIMRVVLKYSGGK